LLEMGGDELAPCPGIGQALIGEVHVIGADHVPGCQPRTRRSGCTTPSRCRPRTGAGPTKMWGGNTEPVLERLTKLAPEQSGIGYEAVPS
jgi:hypothetical protein